MYIKSINWIDKEAQEAEVIVSDNNFEVVCFSHPFNNYLNEKLKIPIYCFDVTNIILSFDKIPCLKRKEDTYSYFIRGVFIDKKDKIVILGNIKLSIEDGYVPKDIFEGAYIEFEVSRLNLF